MKNFLSFLCILALLTGTLAGCNREDAKPTPTPLQSGAPSVMPDTDLDPDNGIVEDDDGIITPEDNANSKS